jgi:hypothetical protein
MKRLVVCLGVLTVACMGVVSAQTRSGAAQPVSDAIRSQWESAKKNIRDSAVDVPEAAYSYSPVPGTVRTFGQIVAHVAGANYEFCSAAKGEKTPKAESAFDSLVMKAAIVQGRSRIPRRIATRRSRRSRTRRRSRRSTCRSAVARARAWRRCSATSATSTNTMATS